MFQGSSAHAETWRLETEGHSEKPQTKLNEKKQVPRYWKIDITDTDMLDSLVESLELPESTRALGQKPHPHMVLLSYGDKGTTIDFYKKAAALKALDGCKVNIEVEEVFFDSQVVFVTGSLSAEFPKLCRKHHIIVRAAAGAGHGIAKWLNDLPDERYSSKVLRQKFTLQGAVSLETQQERDIPTETFGQWVQVKKHATRGWAQVSFPSQSVRDFILEQYAQKPLQIHGIPVYLKPHHENSVPVPEMLFVRWDQPKVPPVITEVDLQDLFDWEAGIALQLDAFEVRPMPGDDYAIDIPSSGFLSPDEIGPVYLITFSRSPPPFHVALNESPELEACRRDMQQQGLSHEHASGAKILVRPEVYPRIMQKIHEDETELRSYEVLVSEEYKDALDKALTSHLRGKDKVLRKQSRVFWRPVWTHAYEAFASSSSMHGLSLAYATRNQEGFAEYDDNRIYFQKQEFLSKNTFIHSVPWERPSSIYSGPWNSKRTTSDSYELGNPRLYSRRW